jgi:signal transduction histidine kinase
MISASGMATDSTTRPGPIVLYVDDERTNCIVFEQSLMSEFPIRTCADGPAALKLLEEFEVAVLLTDMRMPKMKGDELLRIVKDKHPRTIRIVVTAFSDAEPMLRAINEGLVARYIVKPWVREEMVQVLRWGVEAWNFGKDAVELQRRLLETERLATIGRFASMFVHDLRTPLTSALLNINILEEEFLPTMRELIARAYTDPTALEAAVVQLDEFERARAEIQKALETSRDFLIAMNNFGKPGAKPGAPPDVDPLPIVRHCMTVCGSIAMKNHAQLDYRGPAQLPHVRISATELTQVLINLLSNGTQAVAARGLENGYVSIDARAYSDHVELTVHDQGAGMAPEILNRIGTPFFTTRSEGTGLGIAQCQRLIGSAGGRLQIESEVGVGTTVTITIPTAA